MTKKTCLKLTVIASLGLASSMVTSTFMDRVRADSPPTDRRPGGVTKTTVRPSDRTVSQKGILGRGILASGSMNVRTVESDGKNIHVVASAYIHETRPGSNYVWSIRATDAKSKEVVFHDIYDHQIFTLPDSLELSPSFEDDIAKRL